MILDLHEIIEVPGASISFQCDLDTERLRFPALVSFSGPAQAEGQVFNVAGVLELSAEAEVDMLVRCDRCMTEFSHHLSEFVTATLKADPDQDDYDDLFPLTGDSIDVSYVLETCLILRMEQKWLCREDCKGLCPTCGRNLNDGPCGCTKPIDPRLAVLGQLLDDIQEV